ncbi:hypothetical protein ASPBRDRAFT_437046 [Aspergillus brasiliensis CBS 101740]|uniref:Uncharacterized protein n=1 Tax=Aspergillus brasiliensis (strain CBS 101740 / IMI 381727 / IBT 21946) TaxID=767769 RepID=A0A1L9U2D6_ASPBC|nr:hypothetical protein ASPBRDRAFT_437046 [Aspergillus brasiliensis CBS 101740]
MPAWLCREVRQRAAPGSTCTGMGVVCTTPTTAALETTPAPAVEELGCILPAMRSTPIMTYCRVVVVLAPYFSGPWITRYSFKLLCYTSRRVTYIFSLNRNIAPGTPNSTMGQKSRLIS